MVLNSSAVAGSHFDGAALDAALPASHRCADSFGTVAGEGRGGFHGAVEGEDFVHAIKLRDGVLLSTWRARMASPFTKPQFNSSFVTIPDVMTETMTL